MADKKSAHGKKILIKLRRKKITQHKCWIENRIGELWVRDVIKAKHFAKLNETEHWMNGQRQRESEKNKKLQYANTCKMYRN